MVSKPTENKTVIFDRKRSRILAYARRLGIILCSVICMSVFATAAHANYPGQYQAMDPGTEQKQYTQNNKIGDRHLNGITEPDQKGNNPGSASNDGSGFSTSPQVQTQQRDPAQGQTESRMGDSAPMKPVPNAQNSPATSYTNTPPLPVHALNTKSPLISRYKQKGWSAAHARGNFYTSNGAATGVNPMTPNMPGAAGNCIDGAGAAASALAGERGGVEQGNEPEIGIQK